MAADRRPYSADEQETFGQYDDVGLEGQELEEEILEEEDYVAADRFGTTPAEEQRGTPLEEQLEAERPEAPGAVNDEWQQGPDPRAGTLHDQDGQYAEEAETDPNGQGEIHVTEDDRDRAASLRETWEEGPPEDATDDVSLDEDRDQNPGPDDWR